MKRTLVFMLFLLISTLGYTQNYKLHTVFIYSFTRYVQWPDAYNHGDFEIMVLGDSPIVEELKSMAQSKKVNDRTIKVTKINSINEIKRCHILFVPSAKSEQITDVLDKVNMQSILVLTEDAGLAVKGSDVNFITKDGKPAIELNQATVNKKNLKVSNELSRLAILI